MTAERAGTNGPPLAARGLRKRFGGVEAVRGFDFELPRGMVSGLIGPNGAGKTTIFNLLSGYIRPDEGEAYVEGERVTQRSPHSISRLGLGRSFQEVRLFGPLTALENATIYALEPSSNSLALTLFRPLSARRTLREALERAHAALEEVGLDEVADVPAEDLSYADQKLLSIARLLAMGSHTFLLDEPASGLDRDGIAVMVRAVRKLVDARHSVMLIEHNLDVVRAVCDRIVFLDRGTVLAQGTPEDVFDRPELAEIYLGD